MPTFQGSTEVTKAYLGASDASRAYLGTTLVREGTPEGPLVALWTFEGPAPEADVVGGRVLTLGANTDVQVVGGKSALAAPSASGQASTADGFLSLAGFSIGMWVHTGTTTGYNISSFKAGATTVAELYMGWRLIGAEYYDVSRALVTTDSGSYSRTYQIGVGPALPSPSWRQIVATYDGATLTLYVDGVARQSGPKTGLVVDPDSFVLDVVATAALTNVGIWDRALSAQEVADLHSAGVTA